MITLIFEGFWHTVTEISLAILPIVLIFLVMQVFCFKMKRRQVLNILSGFFLTYIGLIFFMQGVSVAFLSVGSTLGVGQYLGEIIGARSDNWLLVPIGFVLGFVVAFAEPAVRIMIKQVEELSSGSIKANHLLIAISLGVASAVALSMVRLLTGISIWYFIIPGYLLAFILSRFVNQTFIAIAFDNGGVATGPMCATFILAFCLGIANVIEGRDPILDGFGVVSLIALAPIIVTMLLGVISQQKAPKKTVTKEKSTQEI
ncbi:MAG: DUF1538 domain-containing protein [Sporomusaceae bacterium]|jgi:hypothetical protein|nr:DUF1538 domain-containing protein [Sporomusaceae bacterium]